MAVKRLGKLPLIVFADVSDGDVLTIVGYSHLVPAEKSKWGKERYHIAVKKDGNGQWGLHT